MPVPFSELKTPAGFKCGEVASALQKSIRRGNEREALYWAAELDEAGYGNYVWKRLRVIASEDIGLADTNAVIAVHCLWQNWEGVEEGEARGAAVPHPRSPPARARREIRHRRPRLDDVLRR